MTRFTVTNKTFTQDIPEGTHPAIVTAVEERDGDYGPYLLISYKLADVENDDGEPEIVRQSASCGEEAVGPASKLYGIVSALLCNGKKVSDDFGFDPEDFIGKRCTVWWGTEINKKTNKPRTGVIKVTAPPQAKKPAAPRSDELDDEIDSL